MMERAMGRMHRVASFKQSGGDMLCVQLPNRDEVCAVVIEPLDESGMPMDFQAALRQWSRLEVRSEGNYLSSIPQSLLVDFWKGALHSAMIDFGRGVSSRGGFELLIYFHTSALRFFNIYAVFA